MAALRCPGVEVHYYNIITYIRSILNNLLTAATATTVSSIIRFNGMFIVYSGSHRSFLQSDEGLTIAVIDK